VELDPVSGVIDVNLIGVRADSDFCFSEEDVR
jgi:hypothetical protein